MTVLDRMGMMSSMKDKPRVVARYRGHCRHDVLAWKAAALAHYYDDALLVIESNTADREKNNNTEGDHFGSIINETFVTRGHSWQCTCQVWIPDEQDNKGMADRQS